MIWRLWGIKAIYQGGIRAIWREPTLLVKIIIVIHDMSWLCARSQAWKGAVFSGDNEKTNNVYKEENLLFFCIHPAWFHSTSHHHKVGPPEKFQDVWKWEQ